VIKALSVFGHGWSPYWNRHLKPGTEKNPTEVDVVLQRARRIEGIVVDSRGRPIPGISVRPYPAKVDGLIPGELPEVITDRRGQFRFENLPGPNVELSLSGKGMLRIYKRQYAVNNYVRITMQPLPLIRGRVFDMKTHQPVTNFALKHYATGGGPGAGDSQYLVASTTYTTPGGRFAYRTRSAWKLAVEAPGFLATTLTGIRSAPAEQAEEILLYLVPESMADKLTGTVIDALSQKPLTGIPITCVVHDSDLGLSWSPVTERTPSFERIQRGTTGSDGSFTFFEYGSKATLYVHTAGHGRLIIQPEDRSEFMTESGHLRVPLEPAACVSGTFLAKACPLTDTHVRLYRTAARKEYIGRLETDERGEFRYESLSAGAYRLECSASNEELGSFSIKRKLDLAAGEHKVLHIGNDMGPFTISGCVTYDGKPVDYAEITLKPKFAWDCVEFYSHPKKDGSYRVDGLLPGKYEIRIRKPYVSAGVISETIDVAGDMERDFALRTVPNQEKD